MTTGKTREYSLDRFQREAAEKEEAGTVLIIGEHGTGKTRTVVARVAFLLRRGVSPTNIACVTTTDENAENLRSWMAEHPDVGDHLGEIFVGTITQLCNQVLRNGGARVLGLSPDYTVWNEPTALQMVDLGWIARGGKKLRKRELRDIRDWRSRDMSRWPEDLPLSPGPGHRADIAAAYENELRWQNAVEDCELPALAFLSLNQDPALRDQWASGRARHLLVDDGERLTARQVAVLDKIRGLGGSLMITVIPQYGGSPAARQRPMELLLEPRSRVRTHRLMVDHSHAEGIFQVCSEIRRGCTDDPFPAEETSDGPEERGPWLEEIEGHHEDIMARCLTQIGRLRNLGVHCQDIGVLDPWGRALDRMRSQLICWGIPYRELGAKPTDPPSDVRCATALLTLLLNPANLHAARIAAAANYPNKDRSVPAPISQEWHRVTREMGSDFVTAAAALLDGGKLDPQDRASLEGLVLSQRALLQELDNPEGNVADLCMSALALVDHFKPKGLPKPLELPRSDFLDHCNTPALPGENKRGHLRRILDLWSPALHPGRSYGNQQGVTFASFEAARGMLWDFVFILDVSDQAIPGKVGPYSSAVDAERRLFCDAVTRAKRFLWMYYLTDTGMAGERYVLSRFLQPKQVRDLLELRHVPFEPPSSHLDPFAGRV